MFHNQILELQSQIHYHQQQIEETEQELYQLKAFQSYGDEAFNCVQEAISHIDGKYLDAFKEALLSLFDNPTPTTEKQAPLPTSEGEQEEDKEKSYYELTGRPDLRPTTYEDLTPNITYSSSGRAYIGFNDYKEAEEFRGRLSVPSMISEAEIMNAYKWELKFYADLTYVKELQKDFDDDFEQDEDWTEEQKEELDFQESLIRIAPDIFYQPKNNVCYMGFSNKERANNYGALLKEVHEFTTDYCVANPYVVTNCKYELRFMCSKDNAIRLAPLNLKKELAHPSNQTIVSQWVSKELPTVEDKSYPPISIDEIQPGDIVARASKGRAHFKVTCTREEGDGEVYALCECLVNPIFKTAVGQKFSLKELFLVERGAPALPPSGEAALSSCEAEDADVF